MNMDDPIFLKLGGSLITDKHKTNTAQTERLKIIARQIFQARNENPRLKIVIGHGSGSFGHIPAHQYQTRHGVNNVDEWRGFATVWKAARALNQIVIDTLGDAGLPVIAFPPSACVITSNQTIVEWNTIPLLTALNNGFIPVTQGDTIFDRVIGGTILSTEELFFHLTPLLQPRSILIASIEEGVWLDYPTCSTIIPRISPSTYKEVSNKIQGSAAIDVTGGMHEKVHQMIELIHKFPKLTISIFSGMEPNAIYHALTGTLSGTIISAD